MMNRLVTMLKLLALIGIAVGLWPLIGVFGILVLLFIIYVLFAFFSTHSFDGSGNHPLSFYMGGEWLDDNAPSYEECVTAWMFMLSIAEDLACSADNLEREDLYKRAVKILQLAIQSEVENIRIEKRVVISDLVCLLISNKKAKWLLDELIARKDDLNFEIDPALNNAQQADVLEHLGFNWESKADEFVNAEIASIPKYSEEQLENHAEKICHYMTENDLDLNVKFENYDFTSSKVEADHKWGGNTVTQEGLRLIKAEWSIDRSLDLSTYNLRDEAFDFIYEAEQYNDFSFLYSKTTCEFKGKNVTVLTDIQDVQGRYVWTVHDSAGDVSIHEEPEHLCLEGPDVWKVTLVAGENEVVFDLNNHISNSSAKKFFNVLALLLPKKQ